MGFSMGYQLPWLAVESLGQHWLDYFVTQMGVETTPLPLSGHHFWNCKQFSVWRSVAGWRALTIESLLMSWYD